MSVFFLNFDLNHEDGSDHYTAFADELGKMRGFRVMSNSCLVNVRTSSAQVLLDHLRPFMEDGDRIFAVRMSPENTFYLHAYPGTNTWLEENNLEEEPAKETPTTAS